jgi:hypothetical protein
MTGYREIAQCRECSKEFVQWTTRQEFCDDRCRGAYHRRKYRQIAAEEAEERRVERMNGNGHGTSEQRKEASDALTRIVEKRRSEQRMIRRI